MVSGGEVWPTGGWQDVDPGDVGLDAGSLEQARDYALKGEGAGMITRGGVRVLAWGDLAQRFDIKSSTKSIGMMAMGLALKDGLAGLDDLAIDHLADVGLPPESNAKTGWRERITLRHLATHTAGFDKGGTCLEMTFEPGTHWAYSDGGTNWLADCLTVTVGADLEALLFDRLFSRMGITHEMLLWRENAYREPEIQGIRRIEFGAGVFTTVDALARIGLLHLRDGQWGSERLLPEGFSAVVGTPEQSLKGLPIVNDTQKRYGGVSEHYGHLWWNNGDGVMANVPPDTYWSWGLHESFIIVIPSLDIVASRAGKDWPGEQSPSNYVILEPFLEAIAASVKS